MTYRVALLGAGFIADWHARALRTVKNAALVAVCDKAPGVAATFAAKHGIPKHHASLDAMLREESLDAVHVLVPAEAHFDVAARVLGAGVNVLLEKPAAIHVRQVDALIALANERRARIGVSHNFAFDPAFERLRADVERGQLGALREITVTWNRTLPQLVTGPFDLWMFADPRNVLLELGPHPLSQIAALDGLPEGLRVHASDACTLPNGATVYRRWEAQGQRGRTRSTLRFSLGPGFQQFSVHVRGTLGAATADLENHTYIRHEVSRFGRLGMDVDSAAMVIDEAIQLGSQAISNIGVFALHKLKLRPEGDWLGVGIARGLQSFYADLRGPIDPRLSIERARDIVATCVGMGERAALPASPSVAPRAAAKRLDPPTILVLGGAGFIGQALVRQLVAEGERVRLLARSPGKLGLDLQNDQVEIVRGDMASPHDLDGALRGIDSVFHLAKPSVMAWSDYLRHDVAPTTALAKACIAAQVKRFLYTGTIDAYFAGDPGSIITEETPLDPRIDQRNEYARAKAMSEGVLFEMHRNEGLPLIVLRPGIVIGRGPLAMHPGVAAWSRGRICRLYGEGTNKLPLVLVDDVARGLVIAMRAEGVIGESFNLIGDPLLSARGYVAALARCAHMSLEPIPTPPAESFAINVLKYALNRAAGKPELRTPSLRDEQSRAQLARFDCSKAKTRLGWAPETDLEAMIARGIRDAAEVAFE